jgi:GT2 family glycosyltransferase
VLIVDFNEKFNFSSISNLSASMAGGEYLCFLNTDTEVQNSTWLERMVGHASNIHTGWVGAQLLFPNGKIQHAGLALGLGGLAVHAFANQEITEREVAIALACCRQVEAVTFACAVISKQKFNLLGGLEEKFRVGLNDVDACLTATKHGFKNILCNESVLIHIESATRPRAFSVGGAIQVFVEIMFFLKKWPISKINDRFFTKQQFLDS